MNAICDARVDSQETSTQCLSYDYKTQSTPAAQGGSGGSVTENIPLLPILSPLSLFTKLFMNVSGGGGSGADMARLLKARKSVLDCARGQLGRLKTIAPGSEASKIDIHADAIRKIEDVLTMQINSGVITPPSCTPPAMPDAALVGKNSKVNGDYRNVGSGATTTTVDDSPHPRADRQGAHGDPQGRVRVRSDPRRHLPVVARNEPRVVQGAVPEPTRRTSTCTTRSSHQINNSSWSLQNPSGASAQQTEILQFLANVQTWYNTKMADILKDWKATTDIYGGNLLANTIIPYITEVAESNHSKSSLPAIIFGGSALGMKGGQFQQFTQSRPHNDLWISIAQAYFKTTTPLTNLPAMNADGTVNSFVRTNVNPISGLWAAP